MEPHYPEEHQDSEYDSHVEIEFLSDEEEPDEEEPQVVPQMKEISEDEWDQMLKTSNIKKEEMNMIVMDFLINLELPIVAEAFHRESGCPIGMDSEGLSLVGTQKIVRDLIRNRQFDDAIDTLNKTLTPAFLQNSPRVHFLLEQQKMIEFCRRGDINSALAFSRRFVMWDTFESEIEIYFDFRKHCRRTLLLMLFGDDKSSPVSNLLDYRCILWLADSTVLSMIRFQGRNTDHSIEKALYLLISVESKLNHAVMFPNFNMLTGYPEAR